MELKNKKNKGGRKKSEKHYGMEGRAEIHTE